VHKTGSGQEVGPKGRHCGVTQNLSGKIRFSHTSTSGLLARRGGNARFGDHVFASLYIHEDAGRRVAKRANGFSGLCRQVAPTGQRRHRHGGWKGALATSASLIAGDFLKSRCTRSGAASNRSATRSSRPCSRSRKHGTLYFVVPPAPSGWLQQEITESSNLETPHRFFPLEGTSLRQPKRFHTGSSTRTFLTGSDLCKPLQDMRVCQPRTAGRLALSVTRH
jgi:hypothetical protein